MTKSVYRKKILKSRLDFTFYVIGVGFAYAMTGTLNMNDLVIQLTQYSDGQLAIFAGMSFMLIGLMVKAAIFPLHIWLPAAYSYAPSAVSTLLAALATKTILYFFARLLFEVFTIYENYLIIFLDFILFPLSVIAIFIGTLIATLAGAIYTFLRFYQIALILRLYLTWFPNLNIYSQPFFTLVKLTNPYLRIWRGVMPPVGALDFSPIMGFMIISFNHNHWFIVFRVFDCLRI